MDMETGRFGGVPSPPLESFFTFGKGMPHPCSSRSVVHGDRDRYAIPPRHIRIARERTKRELRTIFVPRSRELKLQGVPDTLAKGKQRRVHWPCTVDVPGADGDRRCHSPLHARENVACVAIPEKEWLTILHPWLFGNVSSHHGTVHNVEVLRFTRWCARPGLAYTHGWKESFRQQRPVEA